MPVPAARGPLSAALRTVLVRDAPATTFVEAVRTAAHPADVLHDGNIQITLTMLYELHLQQLGDGRRGRGGGPQQRAQAQRFDVGAGVLHEVAHLEHGGPWPGRGAGAGGSCSRWAVAVIGVSWVRWSVAGAEAAVVAAVAVDVTGAVAEAMGVGDAVLARRCRLGRGGRGPGCAR